MTDAQYEAKFKEMQKYIPFIQKVIEKLKINNDQQGDNPRKAQLQKMEMLHGLLTDQAKKLKMETLLKCEGVLIKLQAKIEKHSTFLQNEEPSVTSANVPPCSKPTTTSSPLSQANKPKANEKDICSAPASPSPERVIDNDDDDVQPVVIPTERRISVDSDEKEKPSCSNAKPKEHKSRSLDHRQHHQSKRTPTCGEQRKNQDMPIRKSSVHQSNVRKEEGKDKYDRQPSPLKNRDVAKDSHHKSNSDHNSPLAHHRIAKNAHNHSSSKHQQQSLQKKDFAHVNKNEPPALLPSSKSVASSMLQTVKVVITEPLPANIAQRHFPQYHQYRYQQTHKSPPAARDYQRCLLTADIKQTESKPSTEKRPTSDEAYSPDESWEEYNEVHNIQKKHSARPIFERLGDKVVDDLPSTAAGSPQKSSPISIAARSTSIPEVLKSPPLSVTDINNLLKESGADQSSSDISHIGSRRYKKAEDDESKNSLDYVRKKFAQIAKINTAQIKDTTSPSVDKNVSGERLALKYNPHPRHERLQSLSSNDGSECSQQSATRINSNLNDPRLKLKMQSSSILPPSGVNVLPAINTSDPRLKRQSHLSTTSSHPHLGGMSNCTIPPLSNFTTIKDPRISRQISHPPATTIPPPVRRLSTSQSYISSEENWDSDPGDEANKNDPIISRVVQRPMNASLELPAKVAPPIRQKSISQSRECPTSVMGNWDSATGTAPTADRDNMSQSDPRLCRDMQRQFSTSFDRMHAQGTPTITRKNISQTHNVDEVYILNASAREGNWDSKKDAISNVARDSSFSNNIIMSRNSTVAYVPFGGGGVQVKQHPPYLSNPYGQKSILPNSTPPPLVPFSTPVHFATQGTSVAITANRFNSALNDSKERMKYFASKKSQKSNEHRTYKEFKEAKERAQALEVAKKKALEEAQRTANKKIEEAEAARKKTAEDKVKKGSLEQEKSKNKSKDQNNKQQAGATTTSSKTKDPLATPAGESTLDKMYRTQNFNTQFPKASISFKIPKKKTEEKANTAAADSIKESKKKKTEGNKSQAQQTNIDKTQEQTNAAAKPKKAEVVPKPAKPTLTPNISKGGDIDMENNWDSDAEIDQSSNVESVEEAVIASTEQSKIPEKNRDPRCRQRDIQDPQDTDKGNETEMVKGNKAVSSSDTFDIAKKMFLDEATNHVFPESAEFKPQRILRRRCTMVSFGSAPLVDKDKLLKANALMLEDIEEREKLKRKKEEEERQAVRRNKHLAEIFQKTDDNCSVSTQNIITGKRRTRPSMNFNETQNAINIFKHLNLNKTVTPTPSGSGKATKSRIKPKVFEDNADNNESVDDSDGTGQSTKKEFEATSEECEEAAVVNENNREENKEDAFETAGSNVKGKISLANTNLDGNESCNNEEISTSKEIDSQKEDDISNKTEMGTGQERPNAKTTGKKAKKVVKSSVTDKKQPNEELSKGTQKDENNLEKSNDSSTSSEVNRAVKTAHTEEEHQNCAVSSTSTELPSDDDPMTNATPLLKEEADDNEPSSTGSKSSNPTPTPTEDDGSRHAFLNEFVQEIIKPNADKQYILNILEQILSEDKLEIIKTVIDSTMKKTEDEDKNKDAVTKPKEESKAEGKTVAKSPKVKSVKQEQVEESEAEEEGGDDDDDDGADHDDCPSTSLSPPKSGRSTPTIKKKRNELERLNDDIRDMFICEGVLTATGKRMCTLMNQKSNKKDAESLTNKRPTPSAHPTVKKELDNTSAKKRFCRPKPVKAISQPLRRSLRGCKTTEVSFENANDDDPETATYIGCGDLTDELITDSTNTQDTTPTRRKMPVLKPHTPIKLPEETQVRNVNDSSSSKKPKPLNKACPKSKKPKQQLKDTGRDSDAESQSVTTESEDELAEDTPPSSTLDNVKNTNVHWHNQSKYTTWCMLCNKRILAISSSFHYKLHHGENYISRLAPVLVQKFKQGKLSQPLFGVDRSPKQPSWFHRCPFCLQYFNTPLPLWLEHFQNHTAEFRYECSKCHWGSNRIATTRRHITKNCRGASLVNSAVKLMVPSVIKAHVCHLCNFLQLKRTNLERHYIEQHKLGTKNVDLLGYTITLFDCTDVERVLEANAQAKEEQARQIIAAEEQVIDIDDDDDDNDNSSVQKEQEIDGKREEDDDNDDNVNQINKKDAVLETAEEIVNANVQNESNKDITEGHETNEDDYRTHKVLIKIKRENFGSKATKADQVTVKKDPQKQAETKQPTGEAEVKNNVPAKAAMTTDGKVTANTTPQVSTITRPEQCPTAKEVDSIGGIVTPTTIQIVTAATATDIPLTTTPNDQTPITTTDVITSEDSGISTATVTPPRAQIVTAAKKAIARKESPHQKELSVRKTETEIEIIFEETCHAAEINESDPLMVNETEMAQETTSETAKKPMEEETNLSDVQKSPVATERKSPIQIKSVTIVTPPPHSKAENTEVVSADIQPDIQISATNYTIVCSGRTQSSLKEVSIVENQTRQVDDPTDKQGELLSLFAQDREEQERQGDAEQNINTVVESKPTSVTTDSNTATNADIKGGTKMSDLISSSIDMFFQRSKRKSDDTSEEESQPKKPCYNSNQINVPSPATSNIFIPSTSSEPSSPPIQILAQSIVNIDDNEKVLDALHKPATTSIAERLSQRFKVLQEKAKEGNVSKLEKKETVELVPELESRKSADEGNMKVYDTPTCTDEVTVISDDEDWEDIEITESAPSSVPHIQKGKNKSIFQKFGLFKGNTSKTKKHMPPLAFLPKKKTKEKSLQQQHSTTPSPVPTKVAGADKAGNSSSSVSPAVHLGFKPVINIMEDLLPDSPCNDPIDLVPELTPLEPLTDLNDISSILDMNLSAGSLHIDERNTFIQDALDFISEETANERQLQKPQLTAAAGQVQTKTLTQKIQNVGYSLQSGKESSVKFYCLLENCSFLFSSDAMGLENHFLCEHSQIKWKGYCMLCQTQCFPNDQEYSISKEIKHMVDKHVNRPIIEPNSDSSQHSASTGQGGEERPRIKLRRMTGDCLSTSNSESPTPQSTNTTASAAPSSNTLLGALLNAKPMPPTKDMPPQPEMPLTEPLLMDNTLTEPASPSSITNVSKDFVITSVTSGPQAQTLTNRDSPLQISNVISLSEQRETPPILPKISKVCTLATKTAGRMWGQQIENEREELLESAAASLEVSKILANARSNTFRRRRSRSIRSHDDSPGPVVVAETVPVAQAKAGDFVITQTVSAQYGDDSAAAVGFNISIESSALANIDGGNMEVAKILENAEPPPAITSRVQTSKVPPSRVSRDNSPLVVTESEPPAQLFNMPPDSSAVDVTTPPITSRQYKCMANGCKFTTRVPVAMSDHLRFHERRNLSLKCDYFACPFCSYHADDVEDYMKHSDQYHIISKGNKPTSSTPVENDAPVSAPVSSRNICDILRKKMETNANRISGSTAEMQRSLLAKQKETEEEYLKKLRATVEEIVGPTGFPDDKLYRCVIKTCRTQLTESTFHNHILYHISTLGISNPNNYIFKCPHCTAQYHRPAGIKAHIKNHARNRYFCYLCEVTSANPGQMLKHFSDKHWHTLNMSTKELLKPKIVTNADGTEQVQDSCYYVAYTNELSDAEVHKYGEKLILEWQRKKSGSKTHFKSSEIDLLPIQPIFQREANCGECEYKTKVRTNMYRHLLMHKQYSQLPNNTGQTAVASVDPVNPVPCLNSSEKFFDKMTNLASSSLIPSSSSASSTSNPNSNSKTAYKLPHAFVVGQNRFKCGVPDCNYLTLTEDIFRSHLSTLHSLTSSYRCPFCQEDICKRGVSVERIINHLRFHAAVLFRCEECNYLHHMRYVVERHINEKHATMKVNVVRHERSEENLEGTITVTTFQGKKYKENPDTNQNQSSSSSSSTTAPSTPATRSSAGTDATVKSSNTNSSSNSSKSKGKWMCDTCKQKFSTLSQIQMHCQNVHGQSNTPYQCIHCGFGSHQLSQILFHIDEMHPGKTRNARYIYHSIANDGETNVADTRPLWQRNDPTRVRHIRGILMEDEEESEKHRKELGLDKVIDDDDDDDDDDDEDDDNEDEEAARASTNNFIKGYEFGCFHCDYNSERFDDLHSKHYQNAHSLPAEIAKPFMFRLLRRVCCPECRKFTGNFHEMQLHLLNSHNIRHYYAADITMAEHDDNSQRLVCGYCSFHCVKSEHLMKHFQNAKALHAPQDVRIESNQQMLDILKLGTNQSFFRCSLCSELFVSRVAIVYHGISVHQNEDGFSFDEESNTIIYHCALCSSFSSSSESSLLRHMIDHYGRFKRCSFCYSEQISFERYMQHCYAEHREDIRKFKEMYPYNEICQFLLQMNLLFPNGLMLSKKNLLKTKYGCDIAIQQFYEEMYKISQQPPIPRLSIARLVARKSTEAHHKQTSADSSPQHSTETFVEETTTSQPKKITKRRCTLAMGQEEDENSRSTATANKLSKSATDSNISAIKAGKPTLVTDHESSSNQSSEFNVPLAQAKRIKKRRRTVTLEQNEKSPSPHQPFDNTEADVKCKKMKTNITASAISKCQAPASNREESSLNCEYFSYYGIKPEPLDLSKIYTKVAIGGINTPLSIDKFRLLFNIDCQLKLTKCDASHVPAYTQYKHIRKACPASHKIRFS